MKNKSILTGLLLLITCSAVAAFGQGNFAVSKEKENLAKAEAVTNQAIQMLGGANYLNVKTSIGKGRFSLLRDGVIVSFQKFIDVIVFPSRERTDFTENGSKVVQVNTGESGWLYEEHLESFRDQKEKGILGFKRSQRSHYDFLLRGYWKGKAKLSYVGSRPASLGRRNDVVKLSFDDGFEVEFEFSYKGIPMKTLYSRFDSDKKAFIEETRFAQFIVEGGVLSPFVVDHYTNNVQTYRVNYKSFVYNKVISDTIFVKPATPKSLRKKLKL